jgi:hypothetical protein
VKWMRTSMPAKRPIRNDPPNNVFIGPSASA